MSLTNYLYKNTDISTFFYVGNKNTLVWDNILSTKLLSNNNILNNFEIYSSSGEGHPLQSNTTGYKYKNKDIAKYLMPLHYSISGAVGVGSTASTITIPRWASSIAFIIQAPKGNTGANWTSTVRGATVYFIAPEMGGGEVYPGGAPVNLSANQILIETSPATNRRTYGIGYMTTRYYGGSASWGSVYFGKYTISESNRPSTMNYVCPNIGYGASILQINDNINNVNSTINVPGGNNATSATSGGNGTSGAIPNIGTLTTNNLSLFSLNNTFAGGYSNSGYAANSNSIINNYSYSSNITMNDANGTLIYWFLI